MKRHKFLRLWSNAKIIVLWFIKLSFATFFIQLTLFSGKAHFAPPSSLLFSCTVHSPSPFPRIMNTAKSCTLCRKHSSWSQPIIYMYIYMYIYSYSNTITNCAWNFAVPQSRFQIIKRFPNRKMNCHHRNIRNIHCFWLGISYRTWWHGWLRHCAKRRKFAGSIPDGVTGNFIWYNPSDRTMALGLTQSVTEISSRNRSWWVKLAGARADSLTTFMCRLSWNLDSSTFWNAQRLSGL
jgi:hypothetical protein